MNHDTSIQNFSISLFHSHTDSTRSFSHASCNTMHAINTIIIHVIKMCVQDEIFAFVNVTIAM